MRLLPASAPALPVTGEPPRRLLAETWLVLGVSLGASAIYAVLSLIRKVTAEVALNRQTTAMNSSVTPDQPWLDLAYQLVGIGLGLLPALLALHLLRRDDADALATIGARRDQPGRDVVRGLALTAVVGLPGLCLYAVARAAGANTTIAAADLTDVWWAIPILVLAAVQNAVLEEVVMVGYLLTRWRQAGWSLAASIAVSALVRGTYHLYQGFGGFVGNALMGALFGIVYARTRRLLPLVIAHTLLDCIAFVGYALLHEHWAWLSA